MSAGKSCHAASVGSGCELGARAADRAALAWGALTASAKTVGPPEMHAALIADVFRRARPKAYGVSPEGQLAEDLPLAVREATLRADVRLEGTAHGDPIVFAMPAGDEESEDPQDDHASPPPAAEGGGDGDEARPAVEGPPKLIELSEEERKLWEAEVLKKTQRDRYNTKPWNPCPITGDTPSPGGGGDGDESVKPQCGVVQFEYPKCWKQYVELPWIGLFFRGELVFLDAPKLGYFCKCCVFRQLVSTKETTIHEGKKDDVDSSPRPPARYHVDRDERLGQYGGLRPDHSTQDTPDTPEDEPGVWADDCHLCFTDEPDFAASSEKIRGDWDFVGLVFDRCRDWKLVAAKRFRASHTATGPSDTNEDVVTHGARLETVKSPKPNAPGAREAQDVSCEEC